jgi:Holliday junction DNA helicase RuvA
VIAYIKGLIAYKTPTFVIIEAGGIGYQINISLFTYAQIEKLEQATLWIYTHHNMQEGSQTLYGFFDATERSMFLHLISVNGVGANTSRIILSGMSPDEVRTAVLRESEVSFNRVKGIGPKTAKRIIVELKDKLMKDSGGEAEALTSTAAGKNNSIREEAIIALCALGFQKPNVQKACNAILAKEPSIATVEALIKLALKQLSS